MKTNLRQSLFSLASVLLLALSACTDISAPVETTAVSRARLSVSLDEDSFRTILPADITENEIYRAELNAFVSGAETAVMCWDFYGDGEKNAIEVLSSAEMYIDAGTYDFILELYANYGGLGQKGVIKNRTVAAGTTNSLAFKTEYLSEGTGAVELYFTWRKEQRISYVSAGLFTDESDGETAVSGYELGQCNMVGDAESGYTADYRKDISAGTYFIRYEVWATNSAGETVRLNALDDVVRVLPGRTTKKTIALENINTLYTIQYNLMADDAQWKDGYTAPAERNAYKTVTLPTAENLSRPDCLFGGWYESSDGGATLTGTALTAIAAGTARDVTLYAKWKGYYARVGETQYDSLAETVAAITNATGDISVTLYSRVTASDLGKAESSGTIANAIKNTGADTVALTVDSGAGIALSGTDCASMFYGCQKLTSADLRGLNTSAVTDMRGMFSNCHALTSLDVSHFDTSAVTDMNCMFSVCSALTSLDLSNFDTSSVTNMGGMFSVCSALTSLDVSGFNTSAVTDMNCMFNGCSALTSLDVSTFDTSSVTNMEIMFSGCSALTSLDVTHFDTSAVTNMNGMFSVCTSLTTLDVSGFDTSAVTDMSCMFRECYALTSLDVTHFDTSAVTDMNYMFYYCSALTSLDVSNFDTSAVTDMSCMFGYCSALTSLDLTNFDTSAVTNISGMFWVCSALTSLDVSNFDTSAVTNMEGMFYNCSSLATLDVTHFDTSSVTNMNRMFEHCSALTSLDVSNFDTSSVTNMGGMFYDCYSLTSLDLSNFDTSSVTNMGGMFEVCSALTSLDVSKFDTSSVTNMCAMFYNCSALTSLDVSSFDTSSVTNMGGMFHECRALTALDVTGFDTSSVADMNRMFSHCKALTSLDLTSFDTSAVTNMECMFAGCSVLSSLDLTSFDTSAVTDMSSMFDNCSWLKTITTSNSFVTTAVTDSSEMFYGCASLVGGAGTTYDSSRLDAAYAHIDGGTTNPGYFSAVAGSVSLTVTIILPDYAQIPVTKTEDTENVTFALNDTTDAWKNFTWIFDGTEYADQTQFVLEKASLAKGSYDLTLEATYHNSTTGTDEPYSYFVQIRVE